MFLKDKLILGSFAALYGVLGYGLSAVVYEMGTAMFYSYKYTVQDGLLNELGTKLIALILMFVFVVYLVITTVVYFLFKKSDFTSAAVFSLLIIAVFGEICLSVVYSSHGDFNNGTMQEMNKHMQQMNENTQQNNISDVLTEFQYNMKCCGVFDPDDYYSKLHRTVLPPSCCPQNDPNYMNCTKIDSYQIGCYAKFVAYFQGFNQFIIWTAILFNVFTMSVYALYIMRHSKWFVVVNTVKLTAEVVQLKEVD